MGSFVLKRNCYILKQAHKTLSKMWLTPELQEHLVYWNNPLESGVVFGSVLVLMVAVKYMSLISVVANLGLALVTSTVAFRIYKSVLSAVKKTDDTGHPFKKYLDIDTTLSGDKVLQFTDNLVNKLNALLKKLKSVFLVEDFVESLKFGVAMYMLTYVGRIINGLTILILIWVSIFSAPRIYRDNQAKIDEAIGPIKIKIDELMSKVKGGARKKSKQIIFAHQLHHQYPFNH